MNLFETDEYVERAWDLAYQMSGSTIRCTPHRQNTNSEATEIMPKMAAADLMSDSFERCSKSDKFMNAVVSER